MFVEPNSTVVLYKGINLDHEYNHTFYFVNEGDRESFFNNTPSKQYTLLAQNYQRYRRGYIKVNLPYADIYDIDYMRFKNTSFENRWFYCFVNGCEYINNNTTLISYTIDVLTTWFFDYTLRECLIERQHASSDRIGENIIPEKFNLGEYDQNDRYQSVIPELVSYYIIVWATFDESLVERNGYRINGVFTPLYPNRFDYSESGENAVAAFLIRVAEAGKTNGIFDICILPTAFFQGDTTFMFNYRKVNAGDTFGWGEDVYVPKNNKLYTYPYTYFHIKTPDTDTSYAYEFFDGATCNFRVSGYPRPNSSVICVPSGYNGNGDFRDNVAQINGYPSLPYTIDTYLQFLAEYKATKNLQIGRALVRTGLALGSMGASYGLTTGRANTMEADYQGRGQVIKENAAINLARGSVETAASGVSWFLDKAAQEKIESLSQISIGGTLADLCGFEQGYYNFIFERLTIKAPICKMIDNFFTMYGYAQNTVGVPNRNARENWTYIKTANCQLNNMGIPEEEESIIKNAFNNGVTFWKTNATIGDYSQSNNPIGG